MYGIWRHRGDLKQILISPQQMVCRLQGSEVTRRWPWRAQSIGCTSTRLTWPTASCREDISTISTQWWRILISGGQHLPEEELFHNALGIHRVPYDRKHNGRRCTPREMENWNVIWGQKYLGLQKYFRCCTFGKVKLLTLTDSHKLLSFFVFF